MLREMDAPGSDIRAAVFSPDAAQVAAAGRSGVVRVWDVATGKQVADFTWSRRICALCYSPDGRLLAAAGEQGAIRLWEGPVHYTVAKPIMETLPGKKLQYVRAWPAAKDKHVADLPAQPGSIFALAFCGNDVLAAGGSGNAIHLWDLGSRQELCRLVGHTGSVATLGWNDKAGTLYSGGFDCTVRTWQFKGSTEEKLSRRYGKTVAR
jgi:WD40 repeat protein